MCECLESSSVCGQGEGGLGGLRAWSNRWADPILREHSSELLHCSCLSFESPAAAVLPPQADCLWTWPLPTLLWFSLFLVQQKNYSFHVLQTSSFFNSSCSSTDVLALLGDLQTHRWSNASDTISFVRPWSQGKFSNKEWEKLQHLFQVYRLSFTRDIRELVKMVPEAHCEWRDGTLVRYPVGESGPRTLSG